MSSKAVCHTCVRAAQYIGRRPRPLQLVRRLNTFSTRSSSTYTSPVRQNDPEDLDIVGKTASLKIKKDGKSDLSRLLVAEDDLFHPLSKSPIPSMRQRAAFMKAHAYCPHPSHNRTRIVSTEADPESRKPITGGLPPAHVSYECEYCGIPVSCSEQHWLEDYEEHMKYCDTLREINEDDHDIRSGRHFNEFDFQGPSIEESVINFTNWDTLLYTRDFDAINDPRSMRHATKLMTYPLTIGSVLHELSPYNIRQGGRLTPEGLRSFTGLSSLSLTSMLN
jgi:splicing suppressor protein 51